MSAAPALRAASHRLKWTVGLVSLVVFTAASRDWPQYRGPNHDGVSTDRLNKQWTGAVTNPVWRVQATNGLSSLAVSGGRVFTQIRRNISSVNKEVCVALDAANGAELWAVAVDNAVYPDTGVGPDDGPRSTPTVDGDSVYVLSSYLKLYRLNVTNGATTWSTNLLAGYGGDVIGWQNAASPLLDSGLIFINVNCGTSTLVALRTSDANPVWRSQDEAMTHSTPVLATIHGVRQLIFATQSGLVALEPQSGNLLWRFAYPFSYFTSLAVSPVVDEDMIFVCGAHSYGMGSLVVQANFTNNTWMITLLWSANQPAAHWMTPVAYQGFLYGQFGIQSFDSPTAQLKCVDMRTGAVKWSTNNFGRGGTILVDNHLLVLTERGDLVLVQPNTNAYTEVARCLAIPNYNLNTNRCWNVPAVADGRVYLRSTVYGACFDFSMPDLKFDPPQLLPPNQLQLTVRAADGAAIASNRIAGMEIRSATNPSAASSLWVKLTNNLVLTNGVIRVDNLERDTEATRFYIVTEPK
jgi:outer membrane protein assembly factor BamB